MFIPSILFKVKKDLYIVKDTPDTQVRSRDGKEINIAFGYRKDGKQIKITDFLYIRIISEIINRRLKVFFTKEGNKFIDFNKPYKSFGPYEGISVDVYRGFSLDFYIHDERNKEILIHVIPSFSYYINPNINELLEKSKAVDWSNIIKGVNLSTEREYWRKGLGPKSAGILEFIYTSDIDPREFNYSKQIESIRKYYKNKSQVKNKPEIYEYVEKKLSNNRAIIVSKKRQKGKEKLLYYLANMVHITPSTESLSRVLSELL